MKKKNGFVFMETIVVVSVLSITLMILFASYSYILRKSRERNTFDTTETIYKTYYVKDVINSLKPISDTTGRNGLQYYIDTHSANNECVKMGSFTSYVCDLSDEHYPSGSYSGDLFQIKNAFEVDKIYLVNPYQVLKSDKKEEWLMQFDATTIDYINNLGIGVDTDIMIVKYKKQFNKDDSSYEIIHSSMEVN